MRCTDEPPTWRGRRRLACSCRPPAAARLGVGGWEGYLAGVTLASAFSSNCRASWPQGRCWVSTGAAGVAQAMPILPPGRVAPTRVRPLHRGMLQMLTPLLVSRPLDHWSHQRVDEHPTGVAWWPRHNLQLCLRWAAQIVQRPVLGVQRHTGGRSPFGAAGGRSGNPIPGLRILPASSHPLQSAQERKQQRRYALSQQPCAGSPGPHAPRGSRLQLPACRGR